MCPRATLLFCCLIPDWWWDPGDPQFHSHLPTSPLSSQPCTPTPTRVRTALHSPHRPCGNGCPCLRSFSHSARPRPSVPCPWGPARNLSELKQDLGARLPDDRVRDTEAPPSQPDSSSDWSGHSISSDAQRLPGVSCSGEATAWSLAKVVIKQLSFSHCFRVSLLS